MTVYAAGSKYSGITGRAFGSVKGVAKLEYKGELLQIISYDLATYLGISVLTLVDLDQGPRQ